MKAKLNAFLSRKTTMETTVTACLTAFLVALAVLILWAAALVGGWGNLLQTVKFSQILAVVDRSYIGEASTKEVADAGFKAMIDSLSDRWSLYMTREEFDRYKDSQANGYTGVGMTIRRTDEGWEVFEVVPESPAEKAGITAGLLLLRVNGEDVTQAENGEIASLMSVNPDEIQLDFRDAAGEEQQFTVSMERLYINPVSYEMKDGHIGYIQIENFDETAAEKSIEAIETLMEQGADGLIFDVRNNGGGFVSELTDLLDYLLPEGDIFVSVNEDGKEKVITSDEEFLDLPMVVLLNENSYSAAEFFPACLSEYGAATLVGAPSTGKNRSQVNFVLLDGSAVHISTRQYLTPERVDLTEQGGLTPDIVVPDGEGDPQLQAALDVFQ